MKILVLRPDKAGDALKTLPTLRALRSADPSVEITVLSSAHSASIFATESGVEQFTLPSRWEDNVAETARRLSSTQFDIAVSLLCDRSSDVEALIASISASEKFAAWKPLLPGIFQIPRPFSPVGRDETLNIADIVGQSLRLDLMSTVPAMSLSPMLSEIDREEANQRLAPLLSSDGLNLAFCPFAGLAHRTPAWPRWKRFILSSAQDARIGKVFVFGGPAESDRMDEISETQPKIHLCRPTSFRTMGAYFERMDGVVAVDSGPLHLARALGIAHLGILSGGDEARWFAARSQDSILLRRGIVSRFPHLWQMRLALRRFLSHRSLTRP